MRIVIDSNVLQEDSLREFLSKSRKNKALVTDYLLIEALRRESHQVSNDHQCHAAAGSTLGNSDYNVL
jgi:hypothetical protein